jgi:hypothetical protein
VAKVTQEGKMKLTPNLWAYITLLNARRHLYGETNFSSYYYASSADARDILARNSWQILDSLSLEEVKIAAIINDVHNVRAFERGPEDIERLAGIAY